MKAVPESSWVAWRGLSVPAGTKAGEAEHEMMFEDSFEVLVQRFDAARTPRRRARVARAMIRFGAPGIEALCQRVMSEPPSVGDEIVAVLVRNAEETETVLEELVDETQDRGAARALEEIGRSGRAT